MEKIRIKNLRSLKDTGFIEVKPLTILVGKNSSGKSTFLRFFPLMKQTVSTKKNEPILWYSNQNVDFGSFKESLNRESKEKIISFEFDFIVNSVNRRIGNLLKEDLEVHLEIDLNEKVYEKVKMDLFGKCVTFSKSSESDNSYNLEIDGILIEGNFKILNPEVYEELIPKFFMIEDDSSDLERRIYSLKNVFKQNLYKQMSDIIGVDKIKSQSLLREGISNFTSDSTLTLNIMELIANYDKKFISIIEKNINTGFWIIDDIENNNGDIVESLSFDKEKENIFLEYLKKVNIEEFKTICNLLFGFYINRIMVMCNEYLEKYFKNIHYIAPVRASAQRYYRLQGLSIDEIDPMGENIPMAINHLSNSEKKYFKKWMKENFGFEIETQINGGHVTLNISFDNNEKLNLADTGFGFSQILPILLLLWRVENNKSKKRLGFSKETEIQSIVIEQPELHLHPALQARLTDAIVNCIKKAEEKGIKINIIIETHSETIINRIGQLVYKDKISQDFINVLIFGNLSKHNPSNSSISSVSYDEEGVIEDWPLGFFYPEV